MTEIDWASAALYLGYGCLSGFGLGALLGLVTLWVTSFINTFNQF